MVIVVLTGAPTPLMSIILKNSSSLGHVRRSVCRFSASSRLDQSDDVIVNVPGLHHKIFNGRLRARIYSLCVKLLVLVFSNQRNLSYRCVVRIVLKLMGR
ncbi:hypothetical protein RB195_012984 [Necator americanus]|uniref:Uncharacterized protein n=1 Tax=Necator americanus TaxID=51031 RepID=A0ABR1DTF7_NECAM